MPTSHRHTIAAIAASLVLTAATGAVAATAANTPAFADEGIQTAQAQVQPKGAAPAALPADPRVRAAQQALAALRFRTGAIDGILGPQTRAAILDFQDARRLPKSGELDAATLRELGVR